MAMESVNDGATLDVHGIHGDFIGLLGHRFDPFDAMVKRIGFVHERWLEHQVGLDSEVEGLEVGHSTVP